MSKGPINITYWLLASLLLSACAPAPTVPSAPEQDDKPLEEASRPFPEQSFHDLLVAEFAVRRGRYDMALGYYVQQAHETQDTGVTARATRLAQFLKADTAALDTAQLWVELAPEDVEAQYTTASILARNKQPLEGLKHMHEVLKNGGKTNFPSIAASALPLSVVVQEQLESEFDTLLRQYPNNSQLHTSKAILQQKRGDKDAALMSIRHAIELNPDDLHAVVVEARLLQQLDRGDEAFERLEQVLEKHPNNRRLRLQYARLLMPRNIELAKLQFERLLADTPQDADLLLSLALINKETGDSEKARQYFERLLATGKRQSETHYYLAQLSEQQGEPALAIEHYRAIPYGNDYLAASKRIAELQLQLEQLEPARKELQRRRELYPQLSVRLYLVEAELLLQAERLDDSHQLLTEALQSHPQQASLLYLRSLVSEKRQDLSLMESDLRGILAEDANNAIALNALGYILANRGERLEEAYQLIVRARQQKPDDPAILDSLGWVEYRRGNLEAALGHLQLAYKNFPDAEVAAHLGEVLWQLQQQQQAIEVWQQSLEQNPGNPILLETMRRLMPEMPEGEARADYRQQLPSNS